MHTPSEPLSLVTKSLDSNEVGGGRVVSATGRQQDHHATRHARQPLLGALFR